MRYKFVRGSVVTLSVERFATEATLQGDDSRRWVRLSVAKVSEETIDQVCRWLSEIEQLFGWELDYPRNVITGSGVT